MTPPYVHILVTVFISYLSRFIHYLGTKCILSLCKRGTRNQVRPQLACSCCSELHTPTTPTAGTHGGVEINLKGETGQTGSKLLKQGFYPGSQVPPLSIVCTYIFVSSVSSTSEPLMLGTTHKIYFEFYFSSEFLAFQSFEWYRAYEYSRYWLPVTRIYIPLL